jgi:WD40 repeat protein
MSLTSLFTSPVSYLFGYDIFISYTRVDAKDYALKLHEQLKSLDYACFIDRTEAPSGSALEGALNTGLQRSKVFLLIGTERAFNRPYVEYEFREFARTNRPIIAINVDSALTRGERLSTEPWKVISERNLIWIDERGEAVDHGLPSPTVYEGIQNLFSLTRRNVVRRRWVSLVVTIILAVSAYAIGQTVVARTRLKKLNEEIANAETITTQYKSQIEDIKITLGSLKTERDLLVIDRNKAKKDLGTLKTDLATVRTDLRDANQQRDVARDDARKAKELERIARQNAIEQQRLASSRQLAAESATQMEAAPSLAFLLGIRSYQTSPTLEARRSLLSSLLAYPNLSSMAYGNSRKITAMAIDRDERVIVSGGYDGRILFWDATNRQQLHCPQVKHTSAVTAVAFSANGKSVATGDEKGNIYLWDVTSGDKRSEIKTEYMVLSLEFRGNNELALAGNSEIYVWNVADIALPIAYAPLPIEQDGLFPTALAFSADGKTLAVAVGKTMGNREGNEIALYDFDSRRPDKERLRGHKANIAKLAFSSGGNKDLLASADERGHVIVWNIVTHKPIDESKDILAHAGRNIRFSSDGNFLATAQMEGVINVWDVSNPDLGIGRHKSLDRFYEYSDLGIYRSRVAAIAFANRDKTVVTANLDGSLAFWDVDVRQPLGQSVMLPQSIKIVEAEISPDGQTLALLDTNGKVFLQRVGSDDAPVLLQNRPGRITWMAFANAGKRLATFSDDDQTFLFQEVDNHNVVAREVLSEPGNPIKLLTIKPSGHKEVMAAWSNDGIIKLWGISQSAAISEVGTYHQELVGRPGLDISGQRMATSDDGAIFFWDLKNPGAAPQRFSGSGEIIMGLSFFARDEKLVAIDAKKNIIVWDLDKPASNKIYDVPFRMDEAPDMLRLSSDGMTVAIDYGLGNVLLWDVATHSALGLIQIDGNYLRFSADNSRLISMGSSQMDSGNRINITEVGSELLVKRACRIANRPLTAVERFQYLEEGSSPITCAKEPFRTCQQ